MTEWFRVGFISDLHVGSLHAPWPDYFEIGPNNIIKATKGQTILRQYLEDALSHEIANSDLICLMGDICDGNNRKETGVGLSTPELLAQVGAASELLKSIKSCPKIISIDGSGYHQSIEISLDRLVTQYLGGIHYGALKHVKINKFNYILQIAHGCGGGSLYSGSHADRDMMLMSMAEGRGKFDFHVDMICRGHLHHFFLQQSASQTFLQLPCFKTWYPWVKSTSKYGKYQPDLGVVFIDIFKDKVVNVRPRLYPLPHISDNLVEI